MLFRLTLLFWIFVLVTSIISYNCISFSAITNVSLAHCWLFTKRSLTEIPGNSFKDLANNSLNRLNMSHARRLRPDTVFNMQKCSELFHCYGCFLLAIYVLNILRSKAILTTPSVECQLICTYMGLAPHTQFM